VTVAGADTMSLCLTVDSLHRRFSGTDRHGVSVHGAICGNGEARIVLQWCVIENPGMCGNQ
jgi:hypothetical protein